MMMGVALGSLLGVYVLTNVPSTLLKQTLGGLILLYAGYLVTRKHAADPKRSPALGWALAAGAVGGIIGGTVGTSGPPYVIYLSYRLPAKQVLRATLIALFAFDGLWRLGLFAAHGLMTDEVLWLALLLA